MKNKLIVLLFILVFPAAIFAQVAVQPFGTDAEAYGASPLASASTNTTAIQTALNFGGLVTLTTCGTYNVSGRLIISSNTYFRIAPCVTLLQANGTNNNMLVNNNYTQRGYVSGTLTYSSGTISGSGCPAQGGTLILLFSGKSNPNASGYGLYGTAPMGAGGVPGNVTIVNTGGWYASIPATWTAQADSTHFDFIDPMANTNPLQGKTGALANCTGTLTFTGGTLSTGHPSAIQTLTQSGTQITATVSSTTGLVANQSWIIIFGNNNPHAYNGVFQVESVLNATQFTFHTMLLPSGSPSGASGWMLADTNITLDGGIWNYNAANQNTIDTREGCSFVISGAENVEIKNVLFQNPTQDDILDGMVRDFYVHDSSDTGATALQFIKSVGPNFNSRVERIRSVGVDDGVTWMTDEGAVIDLYAKLVWTSGDVINAGADHIDRITQGAPLGASGDVVFFPTPNAYMGGVYAKNVTGSNSVTDSQSSAVRTIPCVAFQGVGANSVLDSFYGENINCNGAWGFRMGNVIAANSPIWTARAVNINQLTCHQQLANNPNAGNAGQACVYEDPGTNVKALSINQMTVGDELITNATTPNPSYIWIFGGVELLNLSNPKMTPSSAPMQPSDLLRIDSLTVLGLPSHANVAKATISGLNQTYGDRVVNITPGNPNTPTIVLRDSYIGSKVGVLAASSANIILDSDTFTNASTGAVQTDDFDATANFTVNVYANNTTIVSGTWGAIAGTDGSFTSTFTWFDQGGNSPVIALPAGDSKNFVSWGASGSPKLIPTPSWCPSGCTNGVLSANLAPTTLYTPTANGTYRLTVYIVLTSAGGGSSTLPSATSVWTDADTNVAISAVSFTPTSGGNNVGANSAGGQIGTNSGTIVFQARANTAIQVGTTLYAGGSPAMQYAVHPKLEYLGP